MNETFNIISKSLRKINWKLYRALFLMGLCPTLWITFRTFLIGKLPDEWSYSIAGQLSWINLIYEILNEAIILPLFYFLGDTFSDKRKFQNKLKTGLIICFILYSSLSLLIIIFAPTLLTIMANDESLVIKSISYIQLESIANIFNILLSYSLVALVSIGKEKEVYKFTFLKLLLGVIVDTFFISTLHMSLNLGVNGIAYSNIIVNCILLFISLKFINRNGYSIFNKEKLSFQWMKDFFKIGGISGLESFIRNLAYLFMVSRMVNIVGEQGIYWVANNFIWGWLLLPIIQLGELIKKETAENKNAVLENRLGYFVFTGIVCIVWIALIPAYKPFLKYILGYEDIEKLFYLIMILIIPYIFYAFQNVYDSTFYGRGKTKYMLLESVITNTIYYGIFFILFILKIWTPTLVGIAIMFGIGNIFDSIVSFIVYKLFIKKYF